MTSDASTMIAAFGAGAVAGVAYLLLLWLAVRVLAYREWPLPLHMVVFYVQSLFRIGIVAAGVLLAILSGATAAHIGLALIGFLAARQVIVSRVRGQTGERA